MKVSVAYIHDQYQFWQSFNMDDNSTVLQAIERAGVLDLFTQINLQQHKVGIFGQSVALDSPLTEGDRIEIYRPIIWQPPVDEDDDD